MRKINLSCLLSILLFVSCKQQGSDVYNLKASDTLICFHIDEATKLPQISVSLFTAANGVDYLSFQNDQNPEILIYNTNTAQLEKRVSIATEGKHAVIGGFGGYYLKNLDAIFIPSLYVNTIYVTDTTGNIKQKIEYPQTTSGQRLIPFICDSKSQMYFIGSNLYIPQTLNRMLNDRVIEDSPISVVIDTVDHIIKAMPMRFPPLITKEDLGTSAGFGLEYSLSFNEKKFVYAFASDDKLVQVSPDYTEIKKIAAKSRYIDEVSVLRIKNRDFNAVLKATCEQASYGNLVYDKYRNVYYRFAFPKTEIESNENYLEILRSGRKLFSIMILDENLETMGETLFAEYTYNPNLYFVREDGLYISTSHTKNPDYSDDKLCFQRIDLIK